MSILKKYYANNYLAENLDFYFLYNDKEYLGSPSGIKILDNSVEGFFGLVGLTGEPGKGKTTLAIQTALYNILILNKPVIYVSLEVNKDLLLSKMISHLTGIPIKKILKGGMNYKESKEYLEALELLLENENLIIIDNGDANFKNIRELILETKKIFMDKYGVEEDILTILDYLNIFKDIPNMENISKEDTNEKTNAQMSEFIKLKNETKANFLILLAKNKQGYGKKHMGSIKGSGDLEYGFETILSLEDPDEEFPISDYPENKETGFKEVNTIISLFKARWEDTNKVIPLYFSGSKFHEPYN